jgi:hypothetical protein
MTKTKSKPAVSAPVEKKGGDGGRISKHSTKVEHTKVAAKAAVAASQVASAKAKKILKQLTVCRRLVA